MEDIQKCADLLARIEGLRSIVKQGMEDHVKSLEHNHANMGILESILDVMQGIVKEMQEVLIAMQKKANAKK